MKFKEYYLVYDPDEQRFLQTYNIEGLKWNWCRSNDIASRFDTETHALEYCYENGIDMITIIKMYDIDYEYDKDIQDENNL